MERIHVIFGRRLSHSFARDRCCLEAAPQRLEKVDQGLDLAWMK